MTWKKRCVSLIVCFALIVSMTVIRPPKAEAIAFEAGIAVPIILAVAIASGITFLSDGMTESGLSEYIGQQLQQYATDFGTTVSEWWDGIGSISNRNDGKLLITSPAYQGIQNFLSWWKNSIGISSGESVNLISSTPFSTSNTWFGAFNLDSSMYTSQISISAGFRSVECTLANLPVGTYRFSAPEVIAPDVFYISSIEAKRYSGIVDFGSKVYLSDLSNVESHSAYINIDSTGSKIVVTLAADLSAGLASGDLVPSIAFMQLHKVGDASLSASQPASYSALDLQDGESVALDLGATVEAGATLEDILAEYLAKIVDNTATAAQEVTTDSGEGEGEGDDDDTAPYLPFIPRIWEKLQGLPDDIADKVHDLFVPSAAFVEALPAEFADVFDSRCGLLTYPAALLADFLTRLATLTAQEPVLRWGNINEPFSDRQLVAAGSYNLNSAIQTEAMQTVYNVYMICVKAAVAFWFVELCKRKYEKIIRS